MNNGRTGTRSQKTRAEVRHTTKRPWAQKGTGRARAGMTSSPIWRGGGRAFPNRPDENFTQNESINLIKTDRSFSMKESKSKNLFSLFNYVNMNFDIEQSHIKLGESIVGKSAQELSLVTTNFPRNINKIDSNLSKNRTGFNFSRIFHQFENRARFWKKFLNGRISAISTIFVILLLHFQSSGE